MKLKRWLSRGIVLAMVVALMVPMPVAAKSGKSGGKLVKSVEYYGVNEAGNWQLNSKTSYKYDKKKNPSEIKRTSYDQYWLGVPVSGSSDVRTAKYKYKGSTPKSMVLKDSAGFVVSKRTYKKGKVASIVTEEKSAKADKTGKVDATISNDNYYVVYAKNGLASAVSNQMSSVSSDGTTSNSSYDQVLAAVQKKGIPSLVLCNYTYTDKDGTTDPSTCYTIFNKKGLAIESGYVDETGAYKPEVAITYTMKKGVVKQAVLYLVDEKGGVTPCEMLKFKYTKTKISKKRFMNMVNSFVDTYVEDENGNGASSVHGFFSWF